LNSFKFLTKLFSNFQQPNFVYITNYHSFCYKCARASAEKFPGAGGYIYYTVSVPYENEYRESMKIQGRPRPLSRCRRPCKCVNNLINSNFLCFRWRNYGFM